MNTALILAGGVGSRMGKIDVPKQYLIVGDRMIISYCLRTFQENSSTDAIYIVADKNWHERIRECLGSNNITKFKDFVEPGETRQLSILNGLEKMKDIMQADDNVIIHDAARPLVTHRIIDECFKMCDEHDGAMPVLPAKDTFYMSKDKETITSLLKRSELFAGQAPESFVFGKYYEINKNTPYEEIKKINGSSEIAYLNNLDVRMIQGDEQNFKITTKDDLEYFKKICANASGRRI